MRAYDLHMATITMGGKPSKGTTADKRLKGNTGKSGTKRGKK